MDNEWQYHQDGRDRAASLGCAVLLGGVIAFLCLIIGACAI